MIVTVLQFAGRQILIVGFLWNNLHESSVEREPLVSHCNLIKGERKMHYGAINVNSEEANPVVGNRPISV